MHPSRQDDIDRGPYVAEGWRVVWTRGEGCAELADLLSTAEPRRVEGDLKAACVAARADLLVAGALTSFDLVPTVVPGFTDLSRVTEVVAAVAGGPHTALVARVAERIASVGGITGTLVSVSRDDDGDRNAVEMLERIGSTAPLLRQEVLRARSAAALVGELGATALLVIGAPGGSWLQRQFFGPGKRLMRTAPNGIVVVRDAPERCFQRLDDTGTAFGGAMRVGDAVRVVAHPATPIVEGGRLVGIVRRSALESADPAAKIAEVMEDPVFVYVDDVLSEVAHLAEFLDGSPVPVVEQEARLLGSIVPDRE